MLLLIWGQLLMLIYRIYNGIWYGRCLRWWPSRKSTFWYWRILIAKPDLKNIYKNCSIFYNYRTTMAVGISGLYFMNAGFRPTLFYYPCGLPKCTHWPLSLCDDWKRKSFLDESNPSDNCHSNIRQCNSGCLLFSLSVIRQRYNKRETWASLLYQEIWIIELSEDQA